MNGDSLLRTFAVARKELLHILRDPQTLFFTLFVPVLELFMLGYAIDTNVRNVRTVMVDQAGTQESRRLVEMFENSQDFRVVARALTADEAYRTIVAGKARVGIIIPEDYSRRLEAGEVVLLPHIGYSPTGEVFNLAWEDVAGSVAIALKADKLLLLTDRLPANARGEPLHELTAREAGGLAKKGTPLTKALHTGLRALAGGVGRVHLVSRRADGGTLLELFTHSGVGTLITADPVERLRQARIEDVGGILALIEPLEADGTLVKRNRELLEREIGNFEVVEHDGVIVGCAALYPFAEQRSAELACLAVAPEFRDSGYGEQLLQACEVRARAAKLRRLFALTTRAAHWFIGQGFEEAGVGSLPEPRKSLYNWKRGSKVFAKKL